MLCTADPDREPPALVANTLLSLMAYEYDVNNKVAYYLSDDGGSELTFHAAYQASVFAKDWLPFCRKYNVEPRAPQQYFSLENSVRGGSQGFQQHFHLIKVRVLINLQKGPGFSVYIMKIVFHIDRLWAAEAPQNRGSTP